MGLWWGGRVVCRRYYEVTIVEAGSCPQFGWVTLDYKLQPGVEASSTAGGVC